MNIVNTWGNSNLEIAKLDTYECVICVYPDLCLPFSHEPLKRPTSAESPSKAIGIIGRCLIRFKHSSIVKTAASRATQLANCITLRTFGNSYSDYRFWVKYIKYILKVHMFKMLQRDPKS